MFNWGLVIIISCESEAQRRVIIHKKIFFKIKKLTRHFTPQLSTPACPILEILPIP